MSVCGAVLSKMDLELPIEIHLDESRIPLDLLYNMHSMI